MILTYNFSETLFDHNGNPEYFGDEFELEVDPLGDGIYDELSDKQREEAVREVFDSIMTDKQLADMKKSFREEDFPDIKTIEDVMQYHLDEENKDEALSLISEYEEDLMENLDWFRKFVYEYYEEEAEEEYEESRYPSLHTL